MNAVFCSLHLYVIEDILFVDEFSLKHCLENGWSFIGFFISLVFVMGFETHAGTQVWVGLVFKGPV